MDAADDPPLPTVALADIVRLRRPYRPGGSRHRQLRPFRFGIVAELLTVLPDGTARNVSLYLYDPARQEILLGPNGVPEFVDCHGSEFELYKRADDQGYTPVVPFSEYFRDPDPEPEVPDGA